MFAIPFWGMACVLPMGFCCSAVAMTRHTSPGCWGDRETRRRSVTKAPCGITDAVISRNPMFLVKFPAFSFGDGEVCYQGCLLRRNLLALPHAHVFRAFPFFVLVLFVVIAFGKLIMSNSISDI